MDKDNKYYGIIKNLVRQHRKFKGYEPIIDDIIDDVYSHSEVIISSIDNQDVIETYLSKVISTSIITVPKKLNFHSASSSHVYKKPQIVSDIENKKSTNNIITNKEKEIKVNKTLVDNMINSVDYNQNYHENGQDINNDELFSALENEDSISIIEASNEITEKIDTQETEINESETQELDNELFPLENNIADSEEIMEEFQEENSEEQPNDSVEEIFDKNIQYSEPVDITNLEESSIILENEDSNEIIDSNIINDTDIQPQDENELDSDDISISIEGFDESNNESNDVISLDLSEEPVNEEDTISLIIDDNNDNLQEIGAQEEIECAQEESENDQQIEIVDNSIDMPEDTYTNEETEPAEGIVLEIQEFDNQDSEQTELKLDDTEETDKDYLQIQNDYAFAEYESSEDSDFSDEYIESTSLIEEQILEEIPDEDAFSEYETTSIDIIEDGENSLEDDIKLISQDADLDLISDENVDDYDILPMQEETLDENDTVEESFDIGEYNSIEFEESEIENDLLENDNNDLEIIQESDNNIVLSDINKKAELGLFDYSIFNYQPSVNNYEFDSENIQLSIYHLASENPELNILQIYHLKYMQKMTISDIANELNMNQESVADALTKMAMIV